MGGRQPNDSRGKEPLLPFGGSIWALMGDSWGNWGLAALPAAFPCVAHSSARPGPLMDTTWGAALAQHPPAGPRVGGGMELITSDLAEEKTVRPPSQKRWGTGTPPTCGIRFPGLSWLSERGRSLRKREGTRAHESRPRRQQSRCQNYCCPRIEGEEPHAIPQDPKPFFPFPFPSLSP